MWTKTMKLNLRQCFPICQCMILCADVDWTEWFMFISMLALHIITWILCEGKLFFGFAYLGHPWPLIDIRTFCGFVAFDLDPLKIRFRCLFGHSARVKMTKWGYAEEVVCFETVFGLKHLRCGQFDFGNSKMWMNEHFRLNVGRDKW